MDQSMKSVTSIVKVNDGSMVSLTASQRTQNDISMASIGDSAHQTDPTKKKVVDESSSSERTSKQQSSTEDKKEDELIPMPEDEDVKEVITPREVASRLEQKTQLDVKRINTIKEAEEEDE